MEIIDPLTAILMAGKAYEGNDNDTISLESEVLSSLIDQARDALESAQAERLKTNLDGEHDDSVVIKASQT